MNRLKLFALAAALFAATIAVSAYSQFAGEVFHVFGDIQVHDQNQAFNPAATATVTIDGSAGTIAFGDAGAFGGEHTVTWAQGGTAGDALDTQFFIADRAYTVTEINVVWGVAESTGAMDVMVERLQSTEACAAGDDLQAAVVDATGTANTVATPTLTSTTANLDLAAGNRLCVDVSATPNEVANLVVTVTLQVN
jgi:hypothetical protein